MNLQTFKAHIKALSLQEIKELGESMQGKLYRARSQAVRLGYCLMLDALVVEDGIRRNPVDKETQNMSDDEILNALGV